MRYQDRLIALHNFRKILRLAELENSILYEPTLIYWLEWKRANKN